MDSQQNNTNTSTTLDPGPTLTKQPDSHNSTNHSPNSEPIAKRLRANLPRNNNAKKIIIFIPIGLPGMGKTRYLVTMEKLLEDNGCKMTIINSDVVRKELMDELRAKIPGISHQKAYDDTASLASQRYNKYVEDAFDKAETLTEDMHALFLDKNHDPEHIKGLIESFSEERFVQRFEIKIVVILPDCVDSFKHENKQYPFSLSFLVRCIQRILARREHETLVGNKMKMFRIPVAFFHMYKDFKFTEEKFKEMGADMVMRLPFTHEDKEAEETVCKEIGKAFCEVLVTERNFQVDEPKMEVFMEQMENLKCELKDPDPELVKKKTVELLKKSIQLFEREQEKKEEI